LYVNKEHELNEAEQRYSQNCDARSDPDDICLLVVHNISLPLGDDRTDYIDALFCNRLDCSAHSSFSDLENMHVSSHLLISRDGKIRQYVPFNKRAWHAGVSSWSGRSSCNDYSIGIELQGTDTRAYEAVQYTVLGQVVRVLLHYYPRLSPSHIVGHQEIAPGRKSDPGASFDWRRLYSEIQLIR
jgi:AmpD protein